MLSVLCREEWAVQELRFGYGSDRREMLFGGDEDAAASENGRCVAGDSAPETWRGNMKRLRWYFTAAESIVVGAFLLSRNATC